VSGLNVCNMILEYSLSCKLAQPSSKLVRFIAMIHVNSEYLFRTTKNLHPTCRTFVLNQNDEN
jgi:hypothetical protein